MKVVWKDFKGELRNVSTALRPAGAASVAKACRFENGILKAAEAFAEAAINQSGSLRTIIPVSATKNLPLDHPCDVIPKVSVGRYSYAFWAGSEGAWDNIMMGRHEVLAISGEAEGAEIGAVGEEDTFPIAGNFFGVGFRAKGLSDVIGHITIGGATGGTTPGLTYFTVYVRHWAGHFDHPTIVPGVTPYVAPFMEYSVPLPEYSINNTVYDGQSVGLQLRPSFFLTSFMHTHIHVFRLESGSSGATFQQIKVCPGTITGPNPSSTPTIHLRANLLSDSGDNYIWDVNSASAPTGRDAGFRGTCISENFTSPPDHTDGCNLLHCGSLVQWHERTVTISNPLFFTSDWPYAFDFPDPVKYVASLSTGAAVFTTKGVFILAGSTPAVYSKREVKSGEFCVSRNGVVAVDNGVVYPSQNGLIIMDATGQWKNLTGHVYTPAEWMAKQPYYFNADVLRSRYIAVQAGGHNAISVDIRTGDASDWDLTNFESLGGDSASPVYQAITYSGEDIRGSELRILSPWTSEMPTHSVYRLLNETDYSVGAADEDRYEWVSDRIKLPRLSGIGYARIYAEWEKTAGASITVEIQGYYVDDEGVSREWDNSSDPLEVSGYEIVRVPPDPAHGKTKFEWVRVTIRGKVPVHMIELADSYDALAESHG